MAVVSLPPRFLPEALRSGANTPNSFGTQVFNASGHKGAAVFLAPKTGNIRTIGFRLATLTTPTDTDFRVETVSAQFPTGTLVNANANIVVASGSLAANSMNTAQLTADAAVTINQPIALVIAPSGTPNYQWSNHSGNISRTACYRVNFTTSWQSGNVQAPIAICQYSDGSYPFIAGLYPITAITGVSINSASSPDHFGMRFQVATAQRCSGGWTAIDLDSDVEMVLFDSDGVTELASAALTNVLRIDTAGRSYFSFSWDGGDEPLLEANTNYYLAARGGSGSTSFYQFEAPSAAALGHYMGSFVAALAEATDPAGVGDWTITTTKIPFMGIEINGVDIPDVQLPTNEEIAEAVWTYGDRTLTG